MFNIIAIIQGNANGKFPWEQPGNGQGNPPPFEPPATIDEQAIWIVALIVFVACLIIMINTIKKLYKNYYESERNKSIYWNNNKNNKKRK